MKKLHKKMVSAILLGVIALGGIGAVAHASPQKKFYEKDMRDFIMRNRGSFYLLKSSDPYPNHLKSVDYKSFEEFKKDIFKLPKGHHYMAKLGISSVIFEKRR